MVGPSALMSIGTIMWNDLKQPLSPTSFLNDPYIYIYREREREVKAARKHYIKILKHSLSHFLRSIFWAINGPPDSDKKTTCVNQQKEKKLSASGNKRKCKDSVV